MCARVALVGLGRMGMPICANLVRAGHDVVATDARADLEGATRAAGACWGPSARAAVKGADVLVTVLPGAAEVRDTMLGSGALNDLREGATWIDMSTCPPRAGRELAEEASRRGVRCLDAPMGGDPEAASGGRLQLFVGGEADLLAECLDLLRALADPERIEHVGASGAGYLAKVLVNLLWFGQAVATAEALLLARKEGLDIDLLRGAIAESAAESHFIRKDLGALLDGDYLSSFRLDRCRDELRAVTALASELGLPHEVASTVEAIYERAADRYGAVDGELLGVALLEEEAGLRIAPGHPQ